MLRTASNEANEIIVMGDISINYFDKCSYIDIKGIFNLFGLEQIISEPNSTTENLSTLIELYYQNIILM